jgi:hypothetical protein
MVPPFSPFLLAILESYGIRAIHVHLKSVALLAVFAYACEAWTDIMPSMAYFRHLFTLRPSGLNQSSGCISFIATTGTEDDFIDLKWVKKVEAFRSRWLFVDVLEEYELFLVTGEPPAKCTTWASEALPEEVLKALRPQIWDLRQEGVTGPMVGVEFVTRRIAPLQDHRRPIWAHQGGDDIWLYASELNADARGKVIRAFFSTTHILSIPRGAQPLYRLGSRDSSRATAGVLIFNGWGPFLADGVTPGPPPSALAANSEQDSSAREAGPKASRDLDDNVDLGEEATHYGRSQSIMVLSDSSNEEDKAAMANEPSGGDAAASSSRDLEEEVH